MAEKHGITLTGFVRDTRFTVYSHPERIEGMPDIPAYPATDTVPAVRYTNGTAESVCDPVVQETAVTLHLNGKAVTNTVCTKDMPEELGAGFFVAAGFAGKIRSVRVSGTDIFVEADQVACVTGRMESAGGFAPDHARGRIDTSRVVLTPEEIFGLAESVTSEAWSATGCLHCSVLYHKGRIAAKAVDISRQNTVDKIIGHMVLHDIPPAECAIASTGRQPAGMVVKAANAKIPVIVSRSASTSAGIEMAEKTGVTLVCFARPPRFTVYTHPERIVLT
jgi:FdhD protein